MALSEDFGTWFTDILSLYYRNVDGYHFPANLNPEKALDPFGVCCGRRNAVQCCLLSEPALGSDCPGVGLGVWNKQQTAGLPWVGEVCQKATLSLSKPQR